MVQTYAQGLSMRKSFQGWGRTQIKSPQKGMLKFTGIKYASHGVCVTGIRIFASKACLRKLGLLRPTEQSRRRRSKVKKARGQWENEAGVTHIFRIGAVWKKGFEKEKIPDIPSYDNKGLHLYRRCTRKRQGSREETGCCTV